MSSKRIVLYYPQFKYRVNDRGWHRFPYAVWALVPGLLKAGFEVEVYDGRVDSPEATRAAIANDPPLFVGISAITGLQLKDAMKMATYVRSVSPKIPIVWGGWHVTVTPEESAKEPLVDYLIAGRAEDAIVKLAQDLESGTTHDKITQVGVGCPFTELPFDRINLDKYGAIWGYLTSFGCIFSCTFCAIDRVYKRRVFYKPMDQVISELKYVVDNYHGPMTGRIIQIQIDDDLFFANKKRVEEFCVRWNNYHNIPMEVLSHVNIMDKYSDEQWDMLYQGGFRRVLIGAESGNQVILDRLNKKFQTPKKMLDFCTRAAKHNLGVDLSCMTGFWDSDDLNDFEDTVRFLNQAMSINPNVQWKLFWVHPYPGTALFKEFIDRGYYMPRTMKEWSDYNLRRAPMWVSQELEDKFNFFTLQFMPAVERQKVRWQWQDFIQSFEQAVSMNQIYVQRSN